MINESAGGSEPEPEMLVRDVVKVIEHAAKDNKIKVIVLDLADLGSASQDKLKAVGSALEKFKAADKKVFATRGHSILTKPIFPCQLCRQYQLKPARCSVIRRLWFLPYVLQKCAGKAENQHARV